MGSSGSKAARRAYPPAAAAAAAARRAPPEAAAAAAADAGVSGAEREREADIEQLAASLPPSEQMLVKDENLVASMQKLMGGVQAHAVDMYANKESNRLYSMPHQTKEEKERQKEGRITDVALMQLLEERQSAWAEGRKIPSVAELARKYGANEDVLRLALKYIALPVWKEDESGQPVGVWPEGLPGPDEEDAAAGGPGQQEAAAADPAQPASEPGAAAAEPLPKR